MNSVSNVRPVDVDTYEAQVEARQVRVVASLDLLAQLGGGTDPTTVVRAILARVDPEETIIDLEGLLETRPELAHDIRMLMEGTVG